MARRRRKRIKHVKKVLKPSRYFQCPRCGAMTLTIDFRKLDSADEKLAEAKCGTCGLHCYLKVPAVLDRVDVYNKIVDLVYEDRLSECEALPEGVAAPAGEGAEGESEEE